MSEITTQDRFRGCLSGLAAGDALGTTLEFKAPGSFQPTDDTSMALCLAASLIECGRAESRYPLLWPRSRHTISRRVGAPSSSTPVRGIAKPLPGLRIRQRL